MTVADLLIASMNDLALLQAGEVPAPEDQALAFARLNDWIDALKTESLSVFSISRTLWTLSSAASYTIGTGAVINVDRPVNPAAIQHIGYVDNSVTPAVEIDGGLPLTEDEWDGIVIKSTTASYPSRFYYQPTFGATGFGLIYPWPIPTASSLQGVIYTAAAVAEFTATSTVLSLPPGYRRFLRTNLAIELASAFSTQPSPELTKAAMESKAAVLRANYRLTDMTIDTRGLFVGSRGHSNIYTNE